MYTIHLVEYMYIHGEYNPLYYDITFSSPFMHLDTKNNQQQKSCITILFELKIFFYYNKKKIVATWSDYYLNNPRNP